MHDSFDVDGPRRGPWLVPVILATSMLAGCGGDDGGSTDAGRPTDARDDAPRLFDSGASDGGPDAAASDAASEDAGSPDASGDGGLRPGPVTIGEELADALCTRIFECCEGSEELERVPDRYIVDSATCRVWMRSYYAGYLFPALAHLEAEGAVVVDEPALRSCAETYGEQSCAEFSTDPGFSRVDHPLLGCSEAIEGMVPAGEHCWFDFQCAAGGLCVDSLCEPAPGRGDPCAGYRCPTGLVCDRGTCRDGLAEGELCDWDDQCARGICIGDGSGGGRDGTCGSICTGGGAGTVPTDRLLEETLARSIGAACAAGSHCCDAAEREALGLEDDELECRRRETGPSSVTQGLLVVLARFARSDATRCDLAEAMRCLERERTCSTGGSRWSLLSPACAWIRGALEEGDVCRFASECRSGICSSPGTSARGRCAAAPGEGRPCVDGQCGPDRYCDGMDVCVSPRPPGEPCDGRWTCEEAACVDGTCTAACDGA